MCLATSAQKPIVFKWEKNGQSIPSNSEIPRIEGGTIHSVLVFDSVKSTDDGNYTCIVSTTTGRDKHTAHLLVKGNYFFHW